MSPFAVAVLVGLAFWLGSELGRRRSVRELRALIGPGAPTRAELRSAGRSTRARR